MMLVNAESDIATPGASELLSSWRACKAWPHTNTCTPAADSCAISPRFGLATPWRARYAGSASAEYVAPSLSSTTKSNCFFGTPLAVSRLTARATRSKPGPVAAAEAGATVRLNTARWRLFGTGWWEAAGSADELPLCGMGGGG